MFYVQWQQAGKTRRKNIDDGSELGIGRSQTSAIILDNPHVSRDHAVLSSANETLRLRNLSKKNEIHVTQPGGADQVLTHDEVSILKSGCVFRLADIEFVVFMRHQESAVLSERSTFKITCPKCGRHIAPSEIFCPFDGTALANGQSVETPE